MNTTVLFVENIIIGFQGALWIVLFIAPYVELGNMKTWLCELKDWSALITIIAVACIYSLGVILGRVFNILTELIKFKRLLRLLLKIKFIEKIFKAAHNEEEELVRVSHQVGILKSYYQYLVGRTRIAEATMFNLPLIVLGLIVNLDWPLWLKALIVFVLAVLCVVVYMTFLGTIEARKKQILENPNIKIDG